MHELLHHEMVLEHGQFEVVDLLDAIEQLFLTVFETFTYCPPCALDFLRNA